MIKKRAEKIYEKNYGPFSFATYLTGIRTLLNLSQFEMATKMGISKTNLCDLEKGRTFVSATSAVRYARKAGFSEKVALEACFQDQLRKANIKKRVKVEERS